MSTSRPSAAISPTAHYTGQVWYHYGLSHRALATLEGRLFYRALMPMNRASALAGGPTLDGLLLARHREIDRRLEAEIAAGRITQVIEIAAGLSPRGWAFARRHRDVLTYIEADLPEMAERKRVHLKAAGKPQPNHRVVALDALADDGPNSLAALAATLDHTQGLAIVTEGLLNYFDHEAVLGMWARFARTLGGFAHGLYLSDLHLARDNRGLGAAAFSLALGAFTRGRTHFHFETAHAAEQALAEAGFASAALGNPPPQPVFGAKSDARSAKLVKIVEASIEAAASARPRKPRGARK